MAQAICSDGAQRIQDWRPVYMLIQGSFYFLQGFFNAGLLIYMQVSMANWAVPVNTQATVLAIAAIPLYLKLFLGLLTDRVSIGRWGRRRPYILMGMALYLPAINLLTTIRSFGIGWVSAVFLNIAAWMLVDTTADALAVEVTPKDLTARMQGVAHGSLWAGIMVGSLLVPSLGTAIGWTPTTVLLILCVLAGSSVTLFYPETAASREALKQLHPLGELLGTNYLSPGFWLAILFFLFFTASRGFDSLINAYLLTELGWARQAETVRIFGLVSAVGYLSRLVGMVIVWRIPSRFLSSIRLYAGVTTIFWLCTLPWILVYRSPENLSLIFAAQVVFGVGFGLCTILGSSLAMRFSRKFIEAFTFATFAAASNLGQVTVGPKTVTAFASQLGGLVPAFFTLVPFSLISLGLLYLILRSTPEGSNSEVVVALTGKNEVSQPAPPAR